MSRRRKQSQKRELEEFDESAEESDDESEQVQGRNPTTLNQSRRQETKGLLLGEQTAAGRNPHHSNQEQQQQGREENERDRSLQRTVTLVVVATISQPGGVFVCQGLCDA